MSDKYRVEWDDAGCEQCGSGRTWGIVLPGDDPPFLGVSFENELEAEEWCGNLNQAYELGQQATRGSGQESARLAAFRKVYEQYRYEDAWIMDPLFLVGDSHRRDHILIRALWTAIKAAVEGESTHD